MKKRKAIVLSVRPKYAYGLVEGIKKYEFRKSFGLDGEVFIYASYPVKRIIGKIVMSICAGGDKYKVINDFKKLDNETLISNEELLEYYKDKKEAMVYQVAYFEKFKESYKLSDFGLNYPPQSFCYINKIPDDIKLLDDENVNNFIKALNKQINGLERR